jgi:hypothetical protein
MSGVWLTCACGHRWFSSLVHGRVLAVDRCPRCEGEPVAEGPEQVRP